MPIVYRVRVASTGWSGGPGLNTFYFSSSGVPAAVDATTVATRVRAAINAAVGVNGAFPSIWTATVNPQVDVLQDTSGALLSSFVVSPGASVVGGNGTTFGAPNLAYGLVMSTALVVNNRRVGGRAFFGPVSATFAGNLTPPGVLTTAITAVGTSLLTSQGALLWSVWHRPKFASGGLITGVTGAAGATRWWSLRSRRD